jgi:acetolactate synthase-1/2/3 large subunit
MKLTGAQILWEALVREGITDIFGYPGGAILPAYDAMLAYPIRHILVRHEQGATHMADGYARASGKVGVAIATSGPGATNMVTGIATAMMDSSPIVCITGQVGSKLIGSDAFQETDITGITLPITKHNYLVTRAEDVAPSVFEAFAVARSGRPGPVLIDITKDAQQGSCDVDWSAAEPEILEADDDALPGDGTAREAIDLINAAERPLILAGHGVMLSGAEREIVALAEKAHIPIAMTLLGIGGVAASHPLNLGMMGMHGESWVNTAIQEADLLIALGMRFDDRVTGNLKTYAPTAKKVHVDIDRAELNKNVRVDVAIAKDLRMALQEWIPLVAKGDRAARAHRRAQGRLRRPRHPESARRRSPVRRARHPRSLAPDGGRRGRRQRRGSASDVGGAVLQAQSLALAHHVGRARDDGLRAAGGDRRQGRVSRRRSLGRRGRRRLPDDDVRARDDCGGESRR